MKPAAVLTPAQIAGIKNPSGSPLSGSNGVVTEAGLKAELYDSYRGKATQPLVTTDSGQLELRASNIPSAALTIVDERLTNTATSGGPAGYIDYDMGAPVTHLGAEFTFESGSTYGGVIALLVWERSMSEGGDIPDSPCHFYLTPTGWGLQYWLNNSVTTIRIGEFATRLTCDGETVYRVEIFIIGDTAIIALPSGEIIEVTDSHIESLAANFAGFEILENDAATDAQPGFVSRWAGTTPVYPYDERTRGAQTLRQTNSAVTAGQPIVKIPTSLTATVTTPTFPAQSSVHAQLVTNFTAPSSGAFMVELEGFVSQSGDDHLAWVLYANSISSSQSVSQTITQRRVIGLQQATFVFEGFPAGEDVELEWQHTSISGLSSFVIDTTGFAFLPKVKVTPIAEIF